MSCTLWLLLLFVFHSIHLSSLYIFVFVFVFVFEFRQCIVQFTLGWVIMFCPVCPRAPVSLSMSVWHLRCLPAHCISRPTTLFVGSQFSNQVSSLYGGQVHDSLALLSIHLQYWIHDMYVRAICKIIQQYTFLKLDWPPPHLIQDKQRNIALVAKGAIQKS